VFNLLIEILLRCGQATFIRSAPDSENPLLLFLLPSLITRQMCVSWGPKWANGIWKLWAHSSANKKATGRKKK